MALTKEWTSFTSYVRLISVGNGNYRQQIVLTPSVPGSTLLRTIVTGHMSVLVPTAGVTPPSDWWSTSDCEMRAVHSPTGANPVPIRNVRQAGDVGRVPLLATPFPDPGGAPEYHVRFNADQGIDSASQRKATPGDTPAMWIYLYYFDAEHALNGAFNPGITVVFSADVLWGH